MKTKSSDIRFGYVRNVVSEGRKIIENFERLFLEIPEKILYLARWSDYFGFPRK